MFRSRAARVSAALFSFALLVQSMPPAAHAGWLSKIGRLADEAGGVGGSALRHGLPGDDIAGAFARHMKTLPTEAPGTASLAAHATQEGHWRFTNRSGEHFTAANPAEMERIAATLLPESAPGAKLDLYLSQETVFQRPDLVKTLPEGAKLHMLAGGGRAFPLARLADTPHRFAAEVRPNVRLRIGEEHAFTEALWQLARPIKRTSVRVVSLEPGARHTLSSVPRIEPATKAAMVDQIDPWKLPAALSSIKGQTLVVTGRVEGELLHFKAPGGEKALSLDELLGAARAADVDVVVLQSTKAVQPGARNWLWQSVEVKGLGDALGGDNLGDFLETLGKGRGGLEIEASAAASGRTRLEIVLVSAPGPTTEGLGNWAESLVSNALGNVVIEAIKVDAADKERRDELAMRFIPGIPSSVQWLYLAGIVMGLVGLGYTRSWWARLWPAEDRAEYSGALGFYAARMVRGLAFLLVFLPLVGIPAGLWAILIGTLEQLWMVLTAPVRAVRWIARKLRPAGG